MAFQPGFYTNEDRVGKDIKFDAPDDNGFNLEMQRIKDATWEAAVGAHPVSTVNKWGSSCPVHAMSFKMVLCESVCWRIGVCSDDFPVNNLWHWWDKFENGTAPPWAIFLAGGKTEPIVAMPPSILKSGNLKINLDEREPVRNTFKGRMQNSPILDKAGRLRLKTGDTIGIVVDTGSRAGDGSITFFVNGIQVHETVHIFSEPGENWYPFVCLGSEKIKVRIQSTGESLNDDVWDTPEEQLVRKANILAKRGATPFPGAGWLFRKEDSGKWTRGWYSLNVDSFRWRPYSVLYINLHRGSNIAAMDSCGTSDPYVEFRSGRKAWVPSMSKNADGFTVVRSKIVKKTLNPVWNEQMELQLHEVEGVLSITCFDKDFLGAGVIGHLHIDMADIFELSCSTMSLRKLHNQCYKLNHVSNSNSDQGHLYISMYVGEKKKEAPDEKVAKKKSIFFGPKTQNEGEMMLHHISRIRPDLDGEADVVLDWKDPRKVMLKVEKRELKEDWLSEVTKCVSTRAMTSMARERIKGMLMGTRPRPIGKDGKESTVLDPSSFTDLGFSRTPVKWPQHPLKTTDKQLKEGYPISFECQLADDDIVGISPLVAKNDWLTEIRFDCFIKVGWLGDKSAVALAEALKVNKTIVTVNLAGNMIADDGAHALAEMLRRNRCIRVLKLNGNSIGKSGAVYLLTAISGDATDRPNVIMRELALDNNQPDVGLENGIIQNCRVTGDIA